MRTKTLARQLALVLLASIAMLATSPSGIADADKIPPADAINHIGQKLTVCGRVASAKFAANANGQPTFLNLDKPYPNHIFTAVIWGRDRTAFPRALLCVPG